MTKKNGILIGIFIVSCAILLILAGVFERFLPVDISLTRCMCALALFAATVVLFIYRHFFFGWLCAGATFYVAEPDIASLSGFPDGDIVPNVIIYVSAISLAIGTTFIYNSIRYHQIFKPFWEEDEPERARSKRKDPSPSGRDSSTHTSSDTYRDGRGSSYVNGFGNSFGKKVQYVSASELNGFKIENNCGYFELFVQNEEEYPGDATIYVANNFGNVAIHVPRSWHVVTNNNAHENFASINIREQNGMPGKMLYLQIYQNCGNIKVV